MTSGIVDSSILIDCLRGRAAGIAFLTGQTRTGRARTHLIVAAELLAGARDKNESAVIDTA